jgi:glutamine synthetase
MNPRFLAILESIKKQGDLKKTSNPSDIFGSLVFTKSVAQQMLPKEVFLNLSNAMDGKGKIKPEYADAVAAAVKDWATTKGATYYTHWFHPLTGLSAEKHDAFMELGADGNCIDRFTGKQLLVGEPDASSFPSGGLRSTYESRGYTGWDPTSPIFILKGKNGNTLCIPSVYYSWTGDVLDNKIPLLRSEKKINDACLRLLKLTGMPADQVYSTLGCEQEYFIVSQSLYTLRPDLVQTGRTLFGVNSPKGQELQDHYLGSVKDTIIDYMRDFEEAAYEVGIPAKTRHNEVAPAQHEVAPVFEKSSLAVDHNMMLMEIMRKTALQHGLSCLLHEKPFAAINGSGKHCNWSLSTNHGINLLDPSEAVDNDLHFLILLAAILQGIHRHSGLLRASIASASNDHRLGGHEAPPAIISVYLGDDLEKLLTIIESGKEHKILSSKSSHDLKLHVIPELPKDTTDRNRTSPFAFTGNKFEFRSVGSSANPSFAITSLNTITAEALNELLDQVEDRIQKGEELLSATLEVIQESIKGSKAIRFFGDNYSHEWVEEAIKRKLPILPRSIDSFDRLKSSNAQEVFKGVLTEVELNSRYDICLEAYSEQILIELRCALEIAQTQIIPVAIKEQASRAESLKNLQKLIPKPSSEQVKELQHLSDEVDKCIVLTRELSRYIERVIKLPLEEKAKSLSKEGFELLERIRLVVDGLEKLVNDELWPLPKYRELLFIV